MHRYSWERISKTIRIPLCILQFHCVYCRSHTEANVRHICEIGVRTRSDLRFGNDWLEKHSWTYLSLIGDETIINLQRTKVYVSSGSVVCPGKIHQNPESNEAWKKRIEWITSSQSCRDFDGISGEPIEFAWNIFPGFDTVKSQIYRADRRNTWKFHRKNSIHVDVQRYFLWNERQWRRMSGTR